MATATGDTPAIPADRGRRLAEVILASSRRAGLRPGSRLPTERQLLYQDDHRELVAALRARDTDRAVEAMRSHLARVSSHLFDEAS